MHSKLLGFTWHDVSCWKNFVILLHRPRHASILAYTRIAFGFLMLIDIPQERGMTHADVKYGDEMRDICHFPYFSFLEPLHSDYMAVLYALLVASSFGILLGFFYRISCLFFVVIYWYIFALDKSTWNNHSYLYGLIGFIFLCMDAHRYMSIDGLWRSKLRDSHVPLWNYTLLRFQIFLVYFYAGLKKTDEDWLMGYSMQRLTMHWVFDPIRYFMSDEWMDILVVHGGGFLLDISAGFLLFFDKTRILGFLFCGMFHAMNSQMFSIGMFPYAMIATMFVFCPDNSFKNFLQKFFCIRRKTTTQKNPTCIYSSSVTKLTWKQSAAALITVVYMLEQLFLPYSHFLTKGYNGWTEGPYGYSWDMMVHNFKNQHVKITYKDKYGEIGYLKPHAFLRSSRMRWTAHPDMTVQYARCLKERLIEMDIEDPSIYIDVWKSLNGRFQQRGIDPSVDLANYDWSPFKSPAFVLPVLSELSDWRSKLKSIKTDLNNQTLSVVFVADFPGLSLENYVQTDFGNTTIEVLRGSVAVAIPSRNLNVSLHPGENVSVPSGEFHVVTTTSSSPSCYFYVYQNTTAKSIFEKVEDYKSRVEAETSEAGNWNLQKHADVSNEDPMIVKLYHESVARNNTMKRSTTEKLTKFVVGKYAIFRRSFLVAYYAFRNIIFGPPTEDQLLDEKMFMDFWTDVRRGGNTGSTDIPSKTEL